jgi:hypothetical protein
MNEYLLSLIALLLLVILIVLFFFWREHKKLAYNQQLLADQLRRNNEDIAGLCSAALSVDQHLFRHDTQLNSLVNAFNALNQAPPSPTQAGTIQAAQISDSIAEKVYSENGYDSVIAKIRNGMGIEQLVNECGLSRDEAVLLSRLHGRKP